MKPTLLKFNPDIDSQTKQDVILLIELFFDEKTILDNSEKHLVIHSLDLTQLMIEEKLGTKIFQEFNL